VSPINILGELKSRIIKAIYTISLSVIQNELLNHKSEIMRISAIKVASRMWEAAKIKGKQTYSDLITCHFLKIMLDDDKDKIRLEVLNRIEFNEMTLHFIVIKTLDSSTKIRISVYKHLK
jgi:hypothetical protein